MAYNVFGGTLNPAQSISGFGPSGLVISPNLVPRANTLPVACKMYLYVRICLYRTLVEYLFLLTGCIVNFDPSVVFSSAYALYA